MFLYTCTCKCIISHMYVTVYSVVASFPGPTSQTIGKAGGGPGTFWHVTDVKLRRHGRGFPLAKHCTNARLRDQSKSWSLYLPLAKTCRLSDFCARSRSRALVLRFANGKPHPCRRNLTSVTCQNVPARLVHWPSSRFSYHLGGGAWERGYSVEL